MTPDSETLGAIRKHALYEELLKHPAFTELVETSRRAVLSQWTLLLTARPEHVERIQGFIEGANYVLEFANAKVAEARLLIDHHEEDRRASFESVRAAAAAQRERTGRRASVGAAAIDD